MPTLEWIGKNKVVNHHVLTVVVLGVLPLLIKTVLPLQHPEGNFLMMIHGDNLEALKALLPQYEGKAISLS